MIIEKVIRVVVTMLVLFAAVLLVWIGVGAGLHFGGVL